jgi:hypothetical protein
VSRGQLTHSSFFTELENLFCSRQLSFIPFFDASFQKAGKNSLLKILKRKKNYDAEMFFQRKRNLPMSVWESAAEVVFHCSAI